MAILGKLIKQGIRIRESLDQEFASPHDLQKLELKKLLLTARNTEFGRNYNFNKVLESFRSGDRFTFYDTYRDHVPTHDYNKIYDEWWNRCLDGQKNITWPGFVKYFALSSGTSEATSKHIPITKEMIKAIRKTSMRQLLTLSKYDLPDRFFSTGTGILMLGGSTHLNYNGTYFTGDLSGITISQLPFWFQHFYKPGQKIAKERDWEHKLEEITRNAYKWDMGVIIGVPAWIQILMEKILDHYRIKSIHELWPNLTIYVHGGVSFEPYQKGFEKLFASPLKYIETYLASEGFIAFQASPNVHSMRLVLNNGIFYEFIPFNSDNFTEDGEMVDNPETLLIDQIEENRDYALLISTCSGAWRYLIGDVVRMVNKEESEIVITGRTKHFLSLCGEHLSVDNMNKAIKTAEDELNIDVKEFTVAGVPHDSLFAHHWYVGTDNDIEAIRLQTVIDSTLKGINDDYRVEREAALKDVIVDVLPCHIFYDYLRKLGKEGGQNKFPRVIRNDQLKDWQAFLGEHAVGR